MASGWNKPNAANQPTEKKGGTKSPSVMKGVIVGAVAVVVGIVCIFAFSGKSEKSVEKGDKDRGRIKEVTPAAGQTNKVEEAKPYAKMTDAEKLKYYRDKYGDNIPESLKPTIYFLEHPPVRSFHPARSRVNIFKQPSDRKIAAVLMVKPGNWMLRPPTFGERFDSDFAAAMKVPIEISDEDSPEDRELKEAVVSVRNEISERIKAGESASSIMQNEIDSLAQLGRYKRELFKQLGEIKRDAKYSDADVKDFVTAANEMLTKQGLPGFKMPSLVARQVSLQKAEQKRKEQQSKNTSKE